jgi:hypothetical protein
MVPGDDNEDEERDMERRIERHWADRMDVAMAKLDTKAPPTARDAYETFRKLYPREAATLEALTRDIASMPNLTRRQQIAAFKNAVEFVTNSARLTYEQGAAVVAGSPRVEYTIAAPGKCNRCGMRTVVTRNGTDKCEACDDH